MPEQIAYVFIKGFYLSGHNLFGIVFKHDNGYRVEYGHLSKFFKSKDNALSFFNDWLLRELSSNKSFRNILKEVKNGSN